MKGKILVFIGFFILLFPVFNSCDSTVRKVKKEMKEETNIDTSNYVVKEDIDWKLVKNSGNSVNDYTQNMATGENANDHKFFVYKEALYLVWYESSNPLIIRKFNDDFMNPAFNGTKIVINLSANIEFYNFDIISYDNKIYIAAAIYDDNTFTNHIKIYELSDDFQVAITYDITCNDSWSKQDVSMTVYDNKLFVSWPANNMLLLKQFDGSSWTNPSFLPGMPNNIDETGGTSNVSDIKLLSRGNELLAAYAILGVTRAVKIRSWDGSQWSTVLDNFKYEASSEVMKYDVVLDEDNKLYVALSENTMSGTIWRMSLWHEEEGYVDGNTKVGFRYNQNDGDSITASSVSLQYTGRGNLFMFWKESTDNTPGNIKIRSAIYKDGSIEKNEYDQSNGFNYEPELKHPYEDIRVVVYKNRLFFAFGENLSGALKYQLYVFMGE